MTPLATNYIHVAKNCLNFQDRSSRSEYWWYVAVNFVAGLALQVLGALTGIPLLPMFVLATLPLGVAVSIRRLHDTDRSGWWLLLILVPFLGSIAVLVLMALPGSEKANRFGAVPAKIDAFESIVPLERTV
ncbi:MAG: DUF805 domain-containing protein [Planctomycetota bacterium]